MRIIAPPYSPRFIQSLQPWFHENIASSVKDGTQLTLSRTIVTNFRSFGQTALKGDLVFGLGLCCSVF